MNLALIVNQSKEDAESFQSIILQNLSERNIHPRIFLNKDFQREDFKDIDCIITLGGRNHSSYGGSAVRNGSTDFRN